MECMVATWYMIAPFIMFSEYETNSSVVLERELTSITKADELLQHITEGSLEKVEEFEQQIRDLHRNYERQLSEMHDTNMKLEARYDTLLLENRMLQDDYDMLEEENHLFYKEVDTLWEILESRDLELQKKTDEIKLMKDGLKELVIVGRDLKEQVKYLKAQAEEDMLRYVEEGRNTIREIDQAKQENARLLATLAEQHAIVPAQTTRW
ncbi:uncharacterized protein LOC128728966 [Anopheles nili]|uniref:uncharacterized protein LOC128728966 n=1 Tax=Anopheles nili TaxID=185578 RepID=UPI00237C080B|nr:uncharacterized protein LOC128728966 [Anopheles nili]